MTNEISDLSPRQRQVLDLICQGLTTQLISERLKLSTNTVAEYRSLILRKMGVSNAVELVNLVRLQKDKAAKPGAGELQAALEAPPELIVVDDDVDYRQIVVTSLIQQGFPCRGAGSCAELEAALQDHLPGIVILDLNLGAEDGLEIARRLRDYPRVGIVMMTTRGMIEQRLDGLAMGADAYLVKPVDMRELIGVINNLHRRLVEARLADSH